MIRDQVAATDHVEAAVTRGPAVPAHHPCPKCGQELLKHDTPPGSRICSNTQCRHIEENIEARPQVE
jgi:hypothetical protein